MIVGLDYVVDQPVAAVFAVMADIERRPEWVTPAVERTPLTKGAIRAGSRYRARDEYPGRRADFVHEITGYEPDHLLHEAWDGPMAGTGVMRFADADGATALTIRMEVNPSGLLRLVAPLLKGWLVRALRKDLVRFEELVAADTG